jgi:RecJ-like exonuclease
MEGIVSAATLIRRGGMQYSIIGDAPLQLCSVLELDLYDKVEIDNGVVLRRSKAGEQEYEALLQKQIGDMHIGANAKRIELKGRPYRAQAKALLPRLAEAAAVLARAIMTGAPVIVRFHNDGDGASGAIALYRAVACLQARFGIGEDAIAWRMNKRIAYSTEELYRDRMFFNSWKSVEKPVLLVTDFGTSPESVQALEAMQEIATVIVLDHHPPYQGFPRHVVSIYLNSWDFGAGSDFTAGLISCMLSELLCKTDVEDLKEASLVCDYSVYAKGDAVAKKDALILDFMTVSRSDSVKPAGMNAVLTDKEKRDEVFMRASNMQEEALTEGVKNIKSYRSGAGINVFVLDFGHIAALNLEFPPLGRLSSILQKHMESLNNLNTVTIVHSLSNISIRVSSDAADKVKILEVIARMKKSVDYELSGGGHVRAAGISVNSTHMSEIVNMLLLELGVERR